MLMKTILAVFSLFGNILRKFQFHAELLVSYLNKSTGKITEYFSD